MGSGQGGTRPILILQNNIGNQFSPTTIAAVVTSRDGKHQLPTHIRIGGQFYGLHQDSMILLEQVRTLDRKRLRDYIGCLDKETMSGRQLGDEASPGGGEGGQSEAGTDRNEGTDRKGDEGWKTERKSMDLHPY